MNMEKINYKEAAVNWIMNEGPTDCADILDDIMNCDAFADNTDDEKMAYASRLCSELQKYVYYVERYVYGGGNCTKKKIQSTL